MSKLVSTIQRNFNKGFKYLDMFKNSILEHKKLNKLHLEDYGFNFNNNLNLNLINNKLQNTSLLNNTYIEELYNQTIDSVDHDVFERSVKDDNSVISDSIDEFVMEDKDLKQSMVKSQSLNTLGNRGLTQVVKRGFSENKTPIKKGIYAGGDFEDLVTQSSIFVDKSLFIKEVMEDGNKVILITMPRRWGKSLNLDMLKRFLGIQVDREGNIINPENTLNYKIFVGNNKALKPLKISNTTIDVQDKEGEYLTVDSKDLQGQFPVIAIDFKDCKGTSFEEVRGRLEGKIYNLYVQHGYLEKFLDKNNQTLKEQEKNQLKSYFEGTSSEKEIQQGISFLSYLLHTYHNKKTWILIDEYDAAANKAYIEFDEKEAKQVAELFRSVYEPALKNNPHLEKGVMTGVQYIVKSGMLSGLNNLEKYNVTDSKYSKYYGVNEEEMKMLVDHFEIDSVKADIIKDWYNGYKENIGNKDNPELIDKYNIWSVVKYLNYQDVGFKSYWEKSGSVDDFLNPILKNEEFKQSLEYLVNGNSIGLKTLVSDFSINDFSVLKDITTSSEVIEINQNGLDLIFSYLFITGYLTSTGNLNFKLPNKEIKTEFETKLTKYYNEIFNIPYSKFRELTIGLSKTFEQNNKSQISQIFTEEFAPKLSNIIKDLKLYGKDKDNVSGVFANEDMMHSLLNNIAIQVVNARFASERRTTKTDGSKGRADMVVEKNGKGIVIEMKYNAKDSKTALEQAKTYEELVSKSDIKVFVGCNITDKQEVFLSGEITDGFSEPVVFEYP
jgi:hypothetical protein